MSCEIEKSIEILTQEWEKSVGDYRYQNPHKLDREYALDIAIQALQEKLNRTPPQPLTLDELRGMDGKPVWVVTLEDAELNPPYWAIVDTANEHRSRGARLVGVENHDDFGAYELYNETWLAYPTEPGRGDWG